MVKVKTILFLSSFYLIIHSISFGQDIKRQLHFILEHNPLDKSEKKESGFHPELVSEFKFAATGLIRTYQRYISTQDSPSCNFSMSCSQFGMTALQRYGVFHGSLMTVDRLLRCNGVRHPYYRIDPKTKLAIDFPMNFYHWEKKE